MFDLDTFLADCEAAVRESTPQLAIRDVLERALSEPDQVAAALPVERAGIGRLANTEDLTVITVAWGPHMRIRPHDHRMWAVIGIYGGGEDNEFFRRAPQGLESRGGKELRTGELVMLGDDTIHAVTNPFGSLAGTIHIYGGDFFTHPRSEWNEATGEELPYDVELTLRMFEEANREAG